jgi:hypothetical protein
MIIFDIKFGTQDSHHLEEDSSHPAVAAGDNNPPVVVVVLDCNSLWHSFWRDEDEGLEQDAVTQLHSLVYYLTANFELRVVARLCQATDRDIILTYKKNNVTVHSVCHLAVSVCQ